MMRGDIICNGEMRGNWIAFVTGDSRLREADFRVVER